MSHPSTTLHRVKSWNPWREASRDPDLVIVTTNELPHSCGSGAWMPVDDGAIIALRPGLSQIERRCTLAHEIVHHEWGGGCPLRGMPDDWRVVNWREEVRVHDEAVRRLVPPNELREWCAGRADFLAVEPWEVAEHWHVTEEYAERALFLLCTDEEGQAS